jgi:hypothetical protein
MCTFESNTITATGANTYTWTNVPSGSENNAIVVVTSTVSTYLNFLLTGQDANGCRKNTSLAIQVNHCTGVGENAKGLSAFVVFPNPSNGDFTIKAERDVQLQLINNLGQIVKNLQLNATNERRAEVKGLSNGVYFITAEGGISGNVQRVIINK